VGTLLGVLRGGGSVLMPVDTAGRVLELLLVLDAAWAAQR
jgi:cleavage and polyadenylation specificity factor subunit 2